VLLTGQFGPTSLGLTFKPGTSVNLATVRLDGLVVTLIGEKENGYNTRNVKNLDDF